MRWGIPLLWILGWIAPLRAERFTFERGLMATRFAVTCHGEDEAKAKIAADEAFRCAEAINAVASDYIADSELLSLSKKIGEPVKVSPVLFALLERSLEFAKRTGGDFDPTLGPLTKLWRESRRVGKLPTAEVLAAARASCGYQQLRLDQAAGTVTLQAAGMRLDLGGIAKGYAADRMLEVMKARGFSATCVAAGGDLRLGDPPPGAEGWVVGIKGLEKNAISEQRLLSNCAVSTSGDLQQVVVIDGVRYAHIIDPRTGLGLTKHFAVTVIAADGTTSDALATAACVAGPDEAEQMAKRWGAREVVVSR